MCGIVGYVGPQQALPILLAGLRRLEYRGYDSAGTAVVADGRVSVVRKAGRLEVLEKELGSEQALPGVTGIGHTRWATHGAPVDVNAHPHVDCSGEVAVIHNGIIENFLALRVRLEAEGHVLTSQTDTECVAHLVEAALAAGQEFPEADQVAVLTPDGFEVTDLDGNPVTPYSHWVDWDLGAAEKGGYAHFMLKEIYEQPLAIKQTLEGRTDLDGRLVLDELRMSEDELREVDKVFVVACGTAYHATLVAVRYARRQRARVLTVSNTVGSSIPRESDAVLYTRAGPEVCVAATKTFAAQILAM